MLIAVTVSEPGGQRVTLLSKNAHRSNVSTTLKAQRFMEGSEYFTE